MPKIIINDLTVDVNSAGRSSAMWNDGKARYHFWFDASAGREGMDGVLYKNPIDYRLTTTDPRYFPTRQLSPVSGHNAPVITEVWARIEREDLIKKARDSLNAEAAAERQRMEAAKVLFLKQQAAAEMYDALILIRDRLERGGLFESHTALTVHHAIAKAEGKE